MKKLNDNQNQPLRFKGDGKVIGQFYNSWDKTYHLAEYEPYKRPPPLEKARHQSLLRGTNW
jgi:hypothetical protein